MILWCIGRIIEGWMCGSLGMISVGKCVDVDVGQVIYDGSIVVCCVEGYGRRCCYVVVIEVFIDLVGEFEIFVVVFYDDVDNIGDCVGIVDGRCVVVQDFNMFNSCRWDRVQVNGVVCIFIRIYLVVIVDEDQCMIVIQVMEVEMDRIVIIVVIVMIQVRILIWQFQEYFIDGNFIGSLNVCLINVGNWCK